VSEFIVFKCGDITNWISWFVKWVIKLFMRNMTQFYLFFVKFTFPLKSIFEMVRW